MKCLKGPVPRVVATASGEAAADQEMAHLLLAQELSGISRSEELRRYSRTSGEEKILRHEKHAKKMSACGHQPSCSNRLGESSRLAVFLLFYKEKGFYARTLVTPAGVI